MAKLKPKALLAQSKVKKGPSQISVATIFTYLVLGAVVVSSVYAAYKYWRRLRADHGLEVARAVDLRGYAEEYTGRPYLRQAGLRAIAAAVLGVDLAKPHEVTMSRWDARSLSDEQINYACVDAFVSSEIARKLQREEQMVRFVS
ncbi:Werner Syndrome-like exonuclease [Panicum miliaceum]|uniref:Werner Syndrome-like exonuclease n=1 Tax=Panicum miliaceum TaxID=4540 RepID=A0A3L6SKR8_PANMI|nr:Werner Syndrome-like exonuclease [Panicum miliaceum]